MQLVTVALLLMLLGLERASWHQQELRCWAIATDASPEIRNARFRDLYERNLRSKSELALQGKGQKA
jgi:hypothetical protein